MNLPEWTTQPGAAKWLLQAIEEAEQFAGRSTFGALKSIKDRAGDLAAQAATQGAGGAQPIAWGDMVHTSPFFTTDKAEAERYSKHCYTLTPLAPAAAGQDALLVAGRKCIAAFGRINLGLLPADVAADCYSAQLAMESAYASASTPPVEAGK